MKILIIPAWYPNGVDHLSGSYHIDFTNELNKHDIKADMLYLYRMRFKDPLNFLKQPHLTIKQHEHFPCYIYKMLNIEPISPTLQLKYYLKKLEKAFINYCKKYGKPDILHAQTIFPSGYATSIIGKKYHIPTIITAHADYLFHLEEVKENNIKDIDFQNIIKKYPHLYDYLSFCLQNSYITAVSNYLLKDVPKYTNNYCLLPNIVDISKYTLHEQLPISDTFNIVTACALRDGKNINLLSKAVKELNTEGYKIHYNVVGDGFKANEFKAYVQDINANDCVTFQGLLNKEQINQLFAQTHCLIMPSTSETFGIPAIEALAAGKPVIISDGCLGPKDFINESNGYFFQNNNLNDLKATIIKMMDNYQNFKPIELRNSILKYSHDEVIKQTKTIYEKLLNQ